jgi:hypothetical protein
MAEIESDLQENQEQAPRLSDLEDGVKLPQESVPKSRRKRLLFALLALLVLAAVTIFFTYRLMRGNTVDLRADKNSAGVVASGKDIRQAAFDSISGSLPDPVGVVSPNAGMANTSSGQPPAGTPTSSQNTILAQVAETKGEKVAAPIQRGISETIAPPEALLARTSETSKTDDRESGYSGKTVTAANSFSVTADTRSIANRTQSIRYAPIARSTPASANNLKAREIQSEKADDKSLTKHASKPSFGSMLPVRLVGVLYTLRTGSLARLELVRDLKTERWQLKRGTVFIGNVVAGSLDRAYVQVKGYIDPSTQTFIKLDGEILGSDGGAGLQGKKRRVSSVWAKILDRAAQAGVQLGASALSCGSSSVIVATDPYGIYRSTIGNDNQSDQDRSFVEVPAGAAGFVLVTTMPEPEPANQNLASSSAKTGTLTDDELAELMTEADPKRIRAALSRMSPDLQQVAQAVLKEIEQEKE